ncbi:histidine kinase [Streptomyces lincolnensis]|uniref:histidine kinase n=1 Tax=Streptomyces lincolnensis TaxID=1915 RepID=A0A1B1M284_STRLN|nr:histidine kinase [Streptomyces lincolnensis]ANS62564.1 histidine kinase [Streptomyces lincolnensis]AXG51489.1 histidine kinase [Streptomyces lincolnensis]QMV04540.1 sensor histidine kinase [Streptomyces lincolnensis]QMV11785.1 sensor histidine kinase [Streptomyces lincolnensis]
METEDRRVWHRQLFDALRPEARRAPLSRRALWADVVLAVLLTFVALVVAARFPGDGPVHVGPRVEYGIPEVPRPPAPGVLLPERESSPPWPLVVLSALPLAVRRLHPLAAFAVVMVGALGIGDRASWITVLTCVIGAYSAVMYSRHRAGAMAGMVVAAVLAGFAFRETDPVFPGWSSPAVVLLVAGVLAGVVRLWRRQLAAGRERFMALERAQEETMRRAVEEERARIAAELHDVVTHNVSVMVIQAGAARKVMDTAPERSKQALLAVEAGGRAAMAELRHVMGLLAAPDTGHLDGAADGLEPQPGLGQLDALIERVRAAGTPVDVTVSLPPDALPPGVELTAYRVVQEALTNTIKHAPGADARVRIGCAGDRLRIEVTDTGAVRGSPQADGNGRGLIGLRERLAVYDGDLTAGPTLTGGYRITADVPWRTA